MWVRYDSINVMYSLELLMESDMTQWIYDLELLCESGTTQWVYKVDYCHRSQLRLNKYIIFNSLHESGMTRLMYWDVLVAI